MIVSTSDPGHQILPLARYLVRCACGYGHDSYAETPEQAIAEIRAQHDPNCATYTSYPYVCREHQTITPKCRECRR